MGDHIIKTGDMLKVTIAPPAVVPMLASPVPLRGSSTNVTVLGMTACLLGDELPDVLEAELPYTAPPFVTPGTGKLTLTLAPSNQTQTTTNGKAILIKGMKFVATFTVSTPAQQPTPAGPVPDPLLTKPGTAEFITTNQTVQAG